MPVWATYVRVDSVDETAERAGGTLPGMPALQDPTGAVIAVHETACAETVNEPGAWIMSSLHTTDTTAAADWYSNVFGWNPAAFGPLTVFTLPGYHGGEEGQLIPRETVAIMAEPDPNVPTHWNVAFRVADADATAARATELGGSVMMGPMDTPGFRSAVLLDPNGAAFTILQHVHELRVTLVLRLAGLN